MAKKKKQEKKEQAEEPKAPKQEIKQEPKIAEIKEEPKEEPKPLKMTKKEAETLAKKYVPKEGKYETLVIDGEEIKANKYDVMYVTADKNVFFKQNEGEARAHASKFKLEIFKVEL